MRRERCCIDLGGAVALFGAAAEERGTETVPGNATLAKGREKAALLDDEPCWV